MEVKRRIHRKLRVRGTYWFRVSNMHDQKQRPEAVAPNGSHPSVALPSLLLVPININIKLHPHAPPKARNCQSSRLPAASALVCCQPPGPPREGRPHAPPLARSCLLLYQWRSDANAAISLLLILVADKPHPLEYEACHITCYRC